MSAEDFVNSLSNGDNLSAETAFKSVMTDGQEGILVSPKDNTQLAKALSYLIDNPEIRKRMGTTGRQRVEEFRWDKVAGEVLAYYKDLVKFNVDTSEIY